MDASSSDIERAISSASSWLVNEKHWNLDEYRISVSEIQSSPQGYINIDVICVRNENSNLLNRSRVLEIELNTGKIETELAARDPAKLLRCLDLERVKVRTEIIQQKLSEIPATMPGECQDDTIDIRRIMLEQVI